MVWDKIEHDFTHPQLSCDAKPNVQPYIKISVFFRKLDSIDYEAFLGHWQTVHADMVAALQQISRPNCALRSGMNRSSLFVW